MAYLSSQLQTLEHGNSEFIPAFQMSIDMASTYCMQTPSVATRTWFLYVNKIIILEARKAKMNWLQALLAVNEILLKAIPGKTEIVILEQRLSLLLNFNSGT